MSKIYGMLHKQNRIDGITTYSKELMIFTAAVVIYTEVEIEHIDEKRIENHPDFQADVSISHNYRFYLVDLRLAVNNTKQK